MDNLHVPKSPGLFNGEPEAARPHQQFRVAQFANHTTEQIRASQDCAFAKLDDPTLVQCVTTWYESCAQAMLSSNYSPIDQWVRRQAGVAIGHHFKLEDLAKLLRICRSSAIETEHWNPDVLSSIDDVINEALVKAVEDPAWKVSANFDYLDRKPTPTASIPVKPAASQPATDVKSVPMRQEPERRVSNRASMQVPIRVSGQGITGYHLDVVVKTESLSSTGLYFLAYEPFSAGLPLHISYQHSKDPGAVNKVFSAKVVRVDRRPGVRNRGIAIQFLAS